MKLVVFCLFAVCCGSLASTSTNTPDVPLQIRKLEEVLRQMEALRGNMQVGSSTFTFSQLCPCTVADVCCLSALQCLSASLNVQYNVTENKPKTKLLKSLRSHITVSKWSTCQDCTSHPKENATTFFNRLESFIQKVRAFSFYLTRYKLLSSIKL
uniref:Interleukin-21 n=1 Tax=Sander lucioperca TaxID=283035 RepID=A0A8C9XVW3_SANLU